MEAVLLEECDELGDCTGVGVGCPDTVARLADTRLDVVGVATCVGVTVLRAEGLSVES